METDTIFVGLDVHARTVTLAWYDGRTSPKQVPTMQLGSDPRHVIDALRKLERKYGARVVACYEAGCMGYTLCRAALSAGIEMHVIAPSRILRAPGDRTKTDSSDARGLAVQLANGLLTDVVVPTVEQERLRDLVRLRDDQVRARTGLRNQLSKFLLRHGHHYALGHQWTKKHWIWLRAIKFSNETQQFVFEEQVAAEERLTLCIERVEAKLVEASNKEPFATLSQRLMCLRGVSLITAMTLVAELGDLRRFNSAHQLMAYVGLVPGERSSGEKVVRTGITKTGNKHVRRALVESAQTYRPTSRGLPERVKKALKEQDARIESISSNAARRLTRRMQRLLSKGKNRNVAVTAVARELCGFVWAIGQTT